MIFRYFTVLFEAPSAFLILVGALAFSMVVGLAFHEFSHAFVADRLGDRTPRRMGRLTLDPRAHLDPFGSLLIVMAGFGWAKPTPVNPYNTKNPQLSMVLIALGGPLSNLLIAALAGILLRLGVFPFFHPFVPASQAALWAELWTQSPENLIGLFLGTVVLLNILLAVFNLLPLAPLDGFRMVSGLLPTRYARELMLLERWSLGILMLLFFMPFLSNGALDPLGTVMDPPLRFFLWLFTGDAARVVLA